MTKRVSWSEEELAALPAGEPDLFDRKSGHLLDDRDKFLNAMAKALSAFANSGGGSLILGVADQGTFDGLPLLEGKTPIREWIEQKIPGLLDYPLSDFRVHTVTRSTPSQIPTNREIVVIDVGDSAAAPHQSARDKVYYHRQGGHSVPARHFYLELLRQRLTSASLEFQLESATSLSATAYEGGLYFLISLRFAADNVGRVAAYQWGLFARSIEHPVRGFLSEPGARYDLVPPFPAPGGRSDGILIKEPILPGERRYIDRQFGFQVTPKARSPFDVEQEIERRFAETHFGFQLATETSPGELKMINMMHVLRSLRLGKQAELECPEYFT